ncbi:hypothetical protein HYG87_02020 [Methanobacterium alkalithermotolerans]|uniref:Uncharacterized protein n=1 Tax=Methanobacterium alkalithermotolerans TaxID=2731220 RepID=A0A8T8K3Y1_9EURY|nr:hypothetical protein [Methanobacterium alkalithermotolerans]QUH22629.1 hypothetical protein HYG87_02020 [Methanobacterium alkalithermotolerans]
MTSCSSSNFPWYEITEADQSINQGDIIRNCPIIIPPGKINDNEEIDTNLEYYTVIVMSQSCDLEQNKIKFVLACPVYKLGDFISRNEFYADKKSSLRQGNVLHYQMLNECTISGFECEHLIVDFKRIFSINYKFLKEFVKENGNRVRLSPPYREWLSQMFARSFMRVGLPNNITPFEDENDTKITSFFKDKGAEKVNADAEEALDLFIGKLTDALLKKSIEFMKKESRNIICKSDVNKSIESMKEEGINIL